MLSVMKNLFVKPVKYEVVAGTSRELERRKMYDLQIKSSKEIWIVAGELDPDFYNGKFADIISEKLNKIPDFKVRILFSKDENIDFEKRYDIIYKENKQLCDLLNDGAFGGRFAMYLSEIRPKNHFGIVDDSILIEKIHTPKADRDVIFVDNYTALVEKYKKYFIKQVKEPDNGNRIKQLRSEDFKKIAAA